MMQGKPNPNLSPSSQKFGEQRAVSGQTHHDLANAIAREVGMVVASESMRRLLALTERVARSAASVLITGSSGTGKELIARAIHLRSLRREQPFIDLNCGALPEHLVESELFGYEKGAFSGADQSKPGLFELADKGTLFLDEIGNLDSKTQVKLLRVLDGMPYYRVGGRVKVTPNVRIIAATNSELERAIEEGGFRADLFHRLCQFQLRVPALAERPEEIRPIAEYFLSLHDSAASLSDEAAAALSAYDWPGNIRELRNVLTHAVTVMEGEIILPSHLPSHVVSSSSGFIARSLPADGSSLDALEHRAITEALMQTDGNQGQAAARLGISRRTLSRRLHSYRQALGVISPEQTSKFRAKVSLPVEVRVDDRVFHLTTSNISEGGLALDHTEPFHGKMDDQLSIQFLLDNGSEISLSARVVWSMADSTGVEFHNLKGDTKNTLIAYLRAKIEEEGWSTNPLEPVS